MGILSRSGSLTLEAVVDRVPILLPAGLEFCGREMLVFLFIGGTNGLDGGEENVARIHLADDVRIQAHK